MIIPKKIITKNWLYLFVQINIVLFLLIFSANTISSLLRSNVTTLEIALNQLFTTPDVMLKTIPVSCLLTSIILVNKLISTSELTAIYSLGFSPANFCAVILKLSIFTCLCVFFLTGFIQPKLLMVKAEKFNFLEKKFRKLKKQGLISSKVANGKMWYRSGNHFFNYSTYNHQNSEITKFESFQLKNNKVFSSTFADKVRIGVIKNKTKIKSISNIDNNIFDQKDVTQHNNGPQLPIHGEDLKSIEEDILSLNILRFKKYINQLDKDGVNSTRYKVTFWQKITVSMSCIVFALMGLTGLTNSNRRSQSTGASIGITFVIVLAYWFMDSFLIELGKNSKLNTYVAAFGSLIVSSLLLIMIRLRQIINNF